MIVQDTVGRQGLIAVQSGILPDPEVADGSSFSIGPMSFVCPHIAEEYAEITVRVFI